MSTFRRWAEYARKAAHRSPRYLAFRLWQEIARHGRRPWSRVRPRLLTTGRLLRLTRTNSIEELWTALRDSPFLLQPDRRAQYVAEIQRRWPDLPSTVLSRAEAVLRHEFDLLGSGPCQLGVRIPWHEDFKSGKQWPFRYAADLDYNDIQQNSDVKIPWELSRCQHFTTLGKAYWLTGDERYAREFVAEVTDWIACNPWYYGINWACTMDVALRAASWIWGFYFFADAEACRPASFRGELLRALWLHGEFIERNLEYADLNGNHYLVDGVGLVFLGTFFRRTRAGRRWLRKGRAIVLGEILNQVTEDGVDFEQSVAYHRLVLEAFLTSFELLRRQGDRLPTPAWERLERMCEFVLAYTKPDGGAPLVGDADDGRVQVLGFQPVRDHRYLLSSAAVLFAAPRFKPAATPFWEETLWLLGPESGAVFDTLPPGPPPSSVAFPAGGFVVMRHDRTHLLVDVGEVGMKGRGGHGHNDVLSFELTIGGVNLVSDCGLYVYTADRTARNLFRSTAFHNTIEVDRQELNRFRGEDLWRLHYDAVPRDIRWQFAAGRDFLAASHAGYERLATPVTHRREFLLDKRRDAVIIRDRLAGRGSHELVWRCHLDPAIEAIVEGERVALRGPSGHAWFRLCEAPPSAVLTVEAGWVSQSYGLRQPTSVLVVRTRTDVPATFSCIFAALSLDRQCCADYTSVLNEIGHEAVSGR